MLKMGFTIRKFDKHNSYKAYLFYHQTFELHREWGTNKKKYRSIVLRNIVLRRNIKVLLRASKICLYEKLKIDVRKENIR